MRAVFVRLGLASLAISSLTQCRSPAPADASPARAPVVLAIFAHPDDESSVAAVLAKYAAAGARVYLAVATDGRLGVNVHAGIPAGDALAAARTEELRCAAEKLGIEPPIQFGLHDQLKMGEGLPSYFEQLRTLREQVVKLFEELQPDAVITWPPSGWSGHPDHRIVSAIVTEVFHNRAWAHPVQLYYPAVPSGRVPDSHPFAGASMDPRFLTVEIAVSPQDYEKGRQALLCHRSQYPAEGMEQLHQSLVATQKGVAHFQAVSGATDKMTSLIPISRT